MDSFWVVAVWTMFCPDVVHTGSPCWGRVPNGALYASEHHCIPARDKARAELTLILGLPEHRYPTAQCRPLDHLNDYDPVNQP